MTISGNINITCNESENIKTFTIFNNNTPLTIEYSATLASLEAIHNGNPDAHAELFNAIKSKNETQDTQISGLSSTKADKSEIPTVNNATLTITQGGTTKGTFTANASSDTTISLDAGASWGSISGTLTDQTDLNSSLGGKVNTSDCYQIYPVIETYKSGASWYRIYSDGWCEQGGEYTTGDGAKTIQLLKSYKNADYFVSFMVRYDTADGTYLYYPAIGTTYTTSTFKFTTHYAYGGAWMACGYLADAEYTGGTYKAYKP